jgi:four helix bundle protein
MGGKNYRDLIAWQKAMDLVEEVYRATKQFPREEIYGLTSQVRRAVVSVPSNIAEGQGRSSAKEFQHFLSIAHGSLREVETQLMIAHRLEYLTEETLRRLMELAGQIGRLTQGLFNSLSKN